MFAADHEEHARADDFIVQPIARFLMPTDLEAHSISGTLKPLASQIDQTLHFQPSHSHAVQNQTAYQ